MTKESRKRTRSSRKRRREHPATAKDRAEWARERRALVGTLITQEGFEAALVVEHVRGSQYLVRLPDGQEVYMSHKKQRGQAHRDPLTAAGWRLWEERR